MPRQRLYETFDHVASSPRPTPGPNTFKSPFFLPHRLPTQEKSPTPSLTYKMIIFILLAMLLNQQADAIPVSIGAATAPTAAHIVLGMHARNSCSDMRSMYDILRSCLFTIAACVYRAVHPNIPNPNLSFWGRLRVTVKITIYALIAPEMMILWALRQRFGANQVAKEVNVLMEMKVKNLKQELKWTQTHGQFMQMGGFARRDTKEVLYLSQILSLVEADHLDVDELHFTEKEINDKSKGDILSKGLVAFQTLWFIFECLARLNQGLPLIELEVVTLAFATLNAVTYGVWWYKPLNVLSPIYLRVRPQLEAQLQPVPFDQSSPPSQGDNTPARSQEEELLIGQKLRKDEPAEVARVESPSGGVVSAVQGTVEGVIEVAKKDVERDGWIQAMLKWFIGRPFLAVVEPLMDLSGDRDDEQYLKSNAAKDPGPMHVSMFYAQKLSKEKFLVVTPLTAFIGMIFGAIHFLSWHAAFPTHTQLLLWRASCIILVVQPFLVMVGNLLYGLEDQLGDAIVGTVIVLGILPFSFGVILYIAARFCVIVLAFLTLCDLPLGAFTNVSWTSYIPHF